MGLFSNFLRNTGREPIAGRSYVIPADTLADNVAKFIAKLETEESADWCMCLWRIHPDDQSISPRSCRVCGATKGSNVHKGTAAPQFNHAFKGIRKVRVDNHPECPVHTKEGLIIKFVQWAHNADVDNVRNTGNAVANGPGAIANTGIMRRD